MASNRDWIQRTIQHRETDAVPYNFMFSPPARRIAEEHYGNDLEASLSLPLRMSGPEVAKTSLRRSGSLRRYDHR